MLVTMPNANANTTVWAVTVDNVGTVVASCEDEAWALFDHYLEQAAIDRRNDVHPARVTLWCNSSMIAYF